jgi:hypothetical protein
VRDPRVARAVVRLDALRVHPDAEVVELAARVRVDDEPRLCPLAGLAAAQLDAAELCVVHVLRLRRSLFGSLLGVGAADARILLVRVFATAACQESEREQEEQPPHAPCSYPASRSA